MDIWADLTLPKLTLGLLGTLLLAISLFGVSLRERWHLPRTFSRLPSPKHFFHRR